LVGVSLLRIADTAAYGRESNWRRGMLFIGALVLALCVGFAVAGAATLYVNYSHGTSQDRAQLKWLSHLLCAPRSAGPLLVETVAGDNAVGIVLYVAVGV
jgi:hypothetical protein